MTTNILLVVKNILKRCGAVAVVFLSSGVSAQAEDLNANAVMNLMTSEQRSSYLQGIVEGMAYARYRQDGTEVGMQCIYKFYYDGSAGKLAILDAFDRFPDHTPGALMAALLEKECPS